MSDQYNATVTSRLDPSLDTMVIRVKPDGGVFPYEAGQYTILGLRRSAERVKGAAQEIPPLGQEDPLIRRAYSITSASSDDQLEFMITLVRTGSLTPRLFQLEVGSRLYLEPRATGLFTLRRASGNRDLLLVATGTAIAPYLSMLRDNFPPSHQEHFVVVHGAAVSWDLVYRAQLEQMAEASVNFTYVPVVSEPSRDRSWSGLSGDLAEVFAGEELEDLLGLPLSPESFDVYLSGSPRMIEDVTAQLLRREFTAGPVDDPQTNIFTERYW